MEKIDLGWGNPYFLLSELSKSYHPTIGSDLAPFCMSYAPDAGEPELIRQVDKITKDLNGEGYKYYIITNGATQALNSVIRVMSSMYMTDQVNTDYLGYPFMQGIIDKNLVCRVEVDFETERKAIGSNHIVIVDSPSNPLGRQYEGYFSPHTVWDAVYQNPIYGTNMHKKPIHEVYINSFSKLIGTTGLRVGWIGTNNPLLYDRILNDALMENATVSKISQYKILDILRVINLEAFMLTGKSLLEANKENLNKLNNILGVDAPDVGMFYCAKVDEKVFKLFDKAGITYVKMNYQGDDMIRLNVGQTYGIIKQAVKRIKKVDKV